MRRFSLVITAPTGSRIVRLLPEGEVTLGRNPVCDIVLSEEQISRQHAKLSVREGALTLEDLGSNNGTFVNGERITRVQTLVGTEVITIGSFQLSISEGEATEGKRRDPQTPSSNRIPATAAPRTTRPPSGISSPSGPNPTVSSIVVPQPPAQPTQPISTPPPVAPPTSTNNAPPTSGEELNPWSSEDGSSQLNARPTSENFEPPFEEEDQTVRLRASQVSVAAKRLEQLEVLEVNSARRPQESPAEKKAEETKRVEVLSRVSEAFTQRPQSAYKEMIDALVALFDADTAVLLLGDNSLEEMKAKIVHHREPLDNGEIPVSRTVIKEVIEQKTPIVTGDVRGDERFEVGASLFLYNLASVMAAPILSEEQLLGILYVNRWRGGAFEDRDLALLTTMASLVSLSLAQGQQSSKPESTGTAYILRQTNPKEAGTLLESLRQLGGQPFATAESTIVVASLTEVEPYLSRLGPQRTGEVINAWRDRLQVAVLKNGGVLLSQDGLTGKALFRHGDGLPGTLAAITCALQCRKATLDWFAERMARLKIRGRFGVHSGRCFVGLCGSNEDPELVAVGESIDGATQLEQAAAPGEILASPTALAFVDGRFELGPIDPARLAGAPEEISQAFAVFGPSTR
jgi:class 3 adenylate cyclase/predicted component of type VI protein secretion system